MRKAYLCAQRLKGWRNKDTDKRKENGEEARGLRIFAARGTNMRVRLLKNAFVCLGLRMAPHNWGDGGSPGSMFNLECVGAQAKNLKQVFRNFVTIWIPLALTHTCRTHTHAQHTRMHNTHACTTHTHARTPCGLCVCHCLHLKVSVYSPIPTSYCVAAIALWLSLWERKEAQFPTCLCLPAHLTSLTSTTCQHIG
eukprot:1159930-Pelagomonas_calceolata.AAC.4